MPLPIFYVSALDNSDFITLSEDTSRHIVQVLQMKFGEQLQLTDGVGNLVTAAIAEEHKKKCSVRVLNRLQQPKKDRSVCVAISLLKNPNRFEWFLEKATEIGVTDIVPILCHRTERQHFRYDRMKQIIIAAMLQSQQVWLPKLYEPTAISELLSSSSFQTKLIAHCEEQTKLQISMFRQQLSVQILIGPEGDFSSDEIRWAIAAGFQPVSLGETRLRAETAGVVAATFLAI